MTLAALEKAPREELIDAVLNVFDLKKAFNSTKRSTVVREAQKIAGAGRLMMTRWMGRTYTFEGKERGLEYNKGTDAGAVLAVWGFDRWINTDTSCQLSAGKDSQNRPIICQPCNFSDDRSTNTRGSNVESGIYQSYVLDPMERWAIREDAKFHIEGPKAPGTLIFSQVIKGVKTKRPDGVDELALCGKPISITHKQKILGVVVCTRPYLYSEGNGKSIFKDKVVEISFAKQAAKIINKHGYFLQPDLSYLINSAYRFHQLRDELTPHRMWLIVNSYFLGKLRFAISFHYLRCTAKQIDAMRFYYGMSMAAILNISTYEALGAACCHNRSVKKGNAAFERLCVCLKMPTIEQLACADARMCLDQMAGAKTDWFTPENSRAKSKILQNINKCRSEGKKYFPDFIAPEIRGTLIDELSSLVKNGPGYEGTKRDIDDHDVISFRQNWEMAVEAAEEYAKLPDVPKMNVCRSARKIFRTKSLLDIGALELNDRRVKRRTPSKPLIPSRICKVYPPDVDGKEFIYIEDQLEYEFSCDKVAPSLWLKKDLEKDHVLCVACGDLVKESELNKSSCQCISCGRSIHKHCLRKLKLSKETFVCSNIKKRIVPVKIGSTKMRDFEGIKPRVAAGRMRCLICGELNNDSNIPKRRCSKQGCSFSCHSECLKSHIILTKKLSGDFLDYENWSCDDVKYWIDRATVERISQDTSVELIRTFMDCYNIEAVSLHANPKKRRYENEESDQLCSYCGNNVPLEQDDHLWSYCEAFTGSPTSKDPMECRSRIKRRCHEIVHFKTITHKETAPDIMLSTDRENDGHLSPPHSPQENDSHACNFDRSEQSEVGTGVVGRSFCEVVKTGYATVRQHSTSSKHRRICGSPNQSLLNQSTISPSKKSPNKRKTRQNGNIIIRTTTNRTVTTAIELSNRFGVLAPDEIPENMNSLENSNTDSVASRTRSSHSRTSRNKINLSRDSEINKRGSILENISTLARIESENNERNSLTGLAENRPALRGSRPKVVKSRTSKINKVALPVRRSERLKRKVDRDALQSLTNQHQESSSQSNNVETLQRSRNKNFRLQVPSSESPRHSEESDRGAPGRAATSNLTSASGY